MGDLDCYTKAMEPQMRLYQHALAQFSPVRKPTAGLPDQMEDVTWLKRKGGRTLSHLIDPRIADAAERLDPTEENMPAIMAEVTFCGREVPFLHGHRRATKHALVSIFQHRFENAYDACLRCGLTRKAAVEKAYHPICLIVGCKLCMEQLRVREDEMASSIFRPFSVLKGIAY